MDLTPQRVLRHRLHRPIRSISREGLQRASLQSDPVTPAPHGCLERDRIISSLISDFAYAFRVEPDGRLIYEWVSPGFTDILGYSLDEIDARGGILSLVYPEDLAIARAHIQRLNAGQRDTAEYRIVSKDGSVHWLRNHAQPMAEPQAGRVIRLYGSTQVITDQKKNELALRASEARYHNLFDSMQEGFALHELICDDGGAPVDYRFLEVNPAFEALTGLTRERVLGRTVREVLPGTEAYWIETYGRVAQTGEPTRLENRSEKLGRTFEVVAYSPYPGTFATIFTDVTERKRTEQDLRTSEERFRKTYFTSPEAISITRLSDGHFVSVNPSHMQMMGYAEAELVGTPAIRLWKNPEERNTLVALVSAGQEVRDFEATLLSRRGEIDVVLSATRIELDGIAHMLNFTHDVTDRKRAQARVRELTSAVEQSPASIVITDTTGIIQYVNPKFTQVTGYSYEEVIGQNPRVLKGGYTTGQEYQHLWGTISAGGEWLGEFHNRRKDGTYFWESARISPILNEHGAITHYLAVKEDITARKQHERQQQAIIAVSTALRAATTRQEMLPVLVDQTKALMDLDNVALVMLEAGELQVTLVSGTWALAQGQILGHNESASGRVVRTGKPYLSHDCLHDPVVHPLAREVKSAAFVPLVADDKILGVLAVGSQQDIEDTQVRLVTAIADIAANALQRARLFEDNRRRADEFAALYSAARELAGQGDQGWLLDVIVTRALEIIPAGGGLVALHDPAQEALVIKTVSGLPVPVDSVCSMGEGLIGRVALTEQPVTVHADTPGPDRLLTPTSTPVASALGIPLIASGILIGVLVVADAEPTQRRFSQADTDLLMLLANHAASAVRNSLILEEAQERAGQLSLLYDAGLALNSVLEPIAQREYLCKIAGQALSADAVVFFQVEDGKVRLELGIGYSASGRSTLETLAPRMIAADGLLHDLVVSQVPINVGDLQSDPRYLAVDPRLRSGLWVPVQSHRNLLGILGVLSRRTSAFSLKDERLLMQFANQTAVAIQNARLFTETERRLHHVQALRQVDVAIASGLELRAILNVLLEQTQSQLGVDAGAVLLLNPHTQRLEHTSSRGFKTRIVEKPRSVMFGGYLDRVLRDRQRLTFPDLVRSAVVPDQADLITAEGFAAHFALPLVFRGSVKGVLEIYHRSPLNPSDEWMEYLEALAGQAALAIDNLELLGQLQRSNAELMQAYDATIEGWSRALDLRDRETEGHSQRVTIMTTDLAQALGINAADLIHIRRGALLHDIGKMGVPDSILLKAGPLDPVELASMRRHPELAFEMLSPIAFLKPALDIPYCHHERWDGTGYPRGLKGEQIPLAARLFAVVDAWDALCSDRPYRLAWREEDVRRHIRQEAGHQFDPQVVAAFLAYLDTRSSSG